MKPQYIKNGAAAASLLFMLLTAVCAQTPTPTATLAFVPPKLPEIVNVEKPSVHSVDPGKLPSPFHTESARRGSKVLPQTRECIAEGAKRV